MKIRGTMIDLTKETWDQDFKKIKVDKSLIVRQASRYPMGSVRMSLGRIITEEDLANARARAAKIKLP